MYDQRHQGTTHHLDKLVDRKRFSKRLSYMIDLEYTQAQMQSHSLSNIHNHAGRAVRNRNGSSSSGCSCNIVSSNHGSVLYMARQARSMVQLTGTPPPQEAAAAAAVPFPGKICLARHKRGCTACSLWNSENLACLIAFLAGNVVCSMYAFCLSVVWKLMPSQLQRFLQSFSLMTLHE
jgi:hypothetical protein